MGENLNELNYVKLLLVLASNTTRFLMWPLEKLFAHPCFIGLLKKVKYKHTEVGTP